MVTRSFWWWHEVPWWWHEVFWWWHRVVWLTQSRSLRRSVLQWFPQVDTKSFWWWHEVFWLTRSRSFGWHRVVPCTSASYSDSVQVDTKFSGWLTVDWLTQSRSLQPQRFLQGDTKSFWWWHRVVWLTQSRSLRRSVLQWFLQVDTKSFLLTRSLLMATQSPLIWHEVLWFDTQSIFDDTKSFDWHTVVPYSRSDSLLETRSSQSAQILILRLIFNFHVSYTRLDLLTLFSVSLTHWISQLLENSLNPSNHVRSSVFLCFNACISRT
jgi:hypothetical protein